MKNSLGKQGRVLLTVHDVAPPYAEEISEIIADFKELSIARINLAVVPCFDGRYDLQDYPEFCRALEALSDSFEIELLLHGLYHVRTGANQRLPLPKLFLSRLWSAGEDEFYQLKGQETANRIRQGLHIFQQVFHLQPRGFIPPAWIFPKSQQSVLYREGISYTESHFSVFQTRTGDRDPSPVIAFSTRSKFRTTLSRCYAGVVKMSLGRRPPLRFAIHPKDYRSAHVRSMIIDLLESLRQSHKTILYRDIFG